jgi:hypothetical protein
MPDTLLTLGSRVSKTPEKAYKNLKQKRYPGHVDKVPRICHLK